MFRISGTFILILFIFILFIKPSLFLWLGGISAILFGLLTHNNVITAIGSCIILITIAISFKD